MRTRVYAARDADTKTRLSYRYRDIADAQQWARTETVRGRLRLEVYQTTQDLPRQRKRP